MNTLELRHSNHAKCRSQQRSIPPLIVDLLRNYGHHERRGSSYTAFFDKKSQKEIKRYIGSSGRKGYLEQYATAYAIFSSDTDSVITVGWKTERFKKNNYRSKRDS